MRTERWYSGALVKQNQTHCAAQNRRERIECANQAMGAPSFSPYQRLDLPHPRK
jgi:hypothetical protein